MYNDEVTPWVWCASDQTEEAGIYFIHGDMSIGDALGNANFNRRSLDPYKKLTHILYDDNVLDIDNVRKIVLDAFVPSGGEGKLVVDETPVSAVPEEEKVPISAVPDYEKEEEDDEEKVPVSATPDEKAAKKKKLAEEKKKKDAEKKKKKDEEAKKKKEKQEKVKK